VELEGEDPVLVAREPIFVVEARDDGADALSDHFALFLGG
jgi:hypothetical protein